MTHLLKSFTNFLLYKSAGIRSLQTNSITILEACKFQKMLKWAPQGPIYSALRLN